MFENDWQIWIYIEVYRKRIKVTTREKERERVPAILPSLLPPLLTQWAGENLRSHSLDKAQGERSSSNLSKEQSLRHKTYSSPVLRFFSNLPNLTFFKCTFSLSSKFKPECSIFNSKTCALCKLAKS